MQAQTHTHTHKYSPRHMQLLHNLSQLQAFSAYLAFDGVLLYNIWIYMMYVSTILKHIFFAIEPGLSAKPSGHHILENSGCHFF